MLLAALGVRQLLPCIALQRLGGWHTVLVLSGLCWKSLLSAWQPGMTAWYGCWTWCSAPSPPYSPVQG